MSHENSTLLAFGCSLPAVAPAGAAMSREPDRLQAAATGLLELQRAGKLPALFIDAGRISLAWPPDHPSGRVRLGIQQAERLIAGESLEQVLRLRLRHRRKPNLLSWQARREEYLHAKAG